MEHAGVRLVNLEDRTLATIGYEKVRTVLEPAIKQRLMTSW
jgi:hypothetical protein